MRLHVDGTEVDEGTPARLAIGLDLPGGDGILLDTYDESFGPPATSTKIWIRPNALDASTMGLIAAPFRLLPPPR